MVAAETRTQADISDSQVRFIETRSTTQSFSTKRLRCRPNYSLLRSRSHSLSLKEHSGPLWMRTTRAVRTSPARRPSLEA